MKTPMMILRDKLLEEIQSIKEAAQEDQYIKAYREALKNIANDIDANMIPMEKEVMINFHKETIRRGLAADTQYSRMFETPDPSPHDHKSKP